MLLGGGWLPKVTGGCSLWNIASTLSPPPRKDCRLRRLQRLLMAKGSFFSAPSSALSCRAVSLPPCRRPLLSCSVPPFISIPSIWVLLTGAPGPISPNSPPHPHRAYILLSTYRQLRVHPVVHPFLELQMSGTGCLLDISSGDIPEVTHTTQKYSTPNTSFVSIKDISKLLILSLETSK